MSLIERLIMINKYILINPGRDNPLKEMLYDFRR
jgi:hypothetical protein